MFKYKVTVDFAEGVGRWVATYEKDEFKHDFLITDWAVNRFGEQKPTLVEEVDELLSLNFLFLFGLWQNQKTAASQPESTTAAA